MSAWSSQLFVDVELLYELCGIRVARARTSDGTRVLLKSFDSAFHPEWDVGLLEAEAQLLESFRLPCFPELISIWHEGTSTWAAYHFHETLSLDHYLHIETLSLPEKLRIGRRILDALSMMHEVSLIHRTLCPHLIRISKDGQTVIFQDLYFSVHEGHRGALVQDIPFPQVSLPFMAPEQFGQIENRLSRASDYYALGQVLYRILSGSNAFQGTDARELLYQHLSVVPKPLHKSIEGLPIPLSQIIQKLLEKVPVDRYLTFDGIRTDLEQAAAIVEGTMPGSTRFPLASTDVLDKLTIPEKIYGRADALQTLIRGVDRFLEGRPTFIMLRGPEYAGKALLVKELWRPLAKSRGYLLQGSLQKYRLGIPYGSLALVLDLHLMQLLYRPKNELEYWRKKITEACGLNLAVLLDLLPSLDQLCPGQAPLQNLPPKQQESRFELTLKNLVRVLCEPNHPLLLFLDQLQFLDGSSARILKSLTLYDPVPHLLFIGAFREDDPEATATFREFLQEAAQQSSFLEIQVPRPERRDIVQMVQDMARSSDEKFQALGEQLHLMSHGDASVIASVIEKLCGMSALRFDAEQHRWQVRDDVVRICQAMSPNMVSLQEEWRWHPGFDYLKYAAILGISFESNDLQALLPQGAVRCGLFDTLHDAIQSGLIVALRTSEFRQFQVQPTRNCSFMFVAKGLRDSILSRLSPAESRTLHEQIYVYLRVKGNGSVRMQTLMKAARCLDEARLHQAVFHAEEVARINLLAAREARKICDYELCLHLVEQALSCFGADRWEIHYQLCVDLLTEKAAAAFMYELRDELDAAVREVVDNARNPLDAFACQELMVEDLLRRNIFQGILYGKRVIFELGLEVPEFVGRAQLMRELLKVIRLGDPRHVMETIMQKGPTVDAKMEAAFRLSQRLSSASYLVEPFLAPLFVCKGILMGHDRGTTAEMPVICQSFSLILLALTGRVSYAADLSAVAREKARDSGSSSTRCRVELLYQGFIRPWLEPIGRSIQSLLGNFQKALDCGDYEFATHSFNLYAIYSFQSGRPLKIFQDEMQKYARLLDELHQEHLIPHRSVFVEAAAVLLGETKDGFALKGSAFNEDEYSNFLHTVQDCAFYYHSAKLMLAFYADDWTVAARHADEALRLREAVLGSWGLTTVLFYGALASLRLAAGTEGLERRRLERKAKKNLQQLRRFMSQVPCNVQHRVFILEAESALLHEKSEDAMRLLHEAMLAARASGFGFEEALAAEQLGFLCESMRLQESADHWLGLALRLYAEWGGVRKAQALLGRVALTSPMAPIEDLVSTGGNDLISFRTAIADIARESDDRLLFKKVVSYAAQLSGAQTGQLLTRDGVSHRWNVIATFQDGQVDVKSPDAIQDSSSVCWPVIGYIERTRSKLVIDDAHVAQSMLPGLEKELYIIKTGVRAIVCLPIITGDRDAYELLGVLYLEHRQMSHAFNGQKIEVLELLAQITAGRIELSSKASSLEASFREVRQVQSALLPNQSISPNYAISHYYRSAEISGGDWFGFFEDEEQGRLYLFVGDVTGHGVPSSLITGTAAGSLYSTLYAFRSASVKLSLEETLMTLVKATNQTVLETGAKVDRLMTMVFIGIDSKTGAGTMISAGHQPGLLLGRNRISGLKAAGSPLGHRTDGNWKPRSFQLEKGDALFLFTDGLLENVGPQGEKMNFRTLEKILENSRSPHDLRRQILEEAFHVWKEHKPSDDITFLLVRWGEALDKALDEPWSDSA
jgi:serine phosphatase RsbU (regulator of sigma subunit)/predicted ATPase